MEKRIGKITNRIIIGGFAFVIAMSVAAIIYGNITDKFNDLSVLYNNIFITLLFLGVYLLVTRFYNEKLAFIPPSYYYIAMIFAYLAIFLGSYLNFYEYIPWWDTMLHFSSGILLGLLSIILVSYIISNRFGKYKSNRDILIIVCIGVLVSMSIAVFWEFYEISYDYITDGNMQRSLIIENPSEFDVESYLRPSGRFVDPGLMDTMKDQFLATAGALIAGVYSYFHFSAIQLEINKESKNTK